MGLFADAHRWGKPRRPPVFKISYTYPITNKFGTVIPQLENIQEIYKSRETPLEFC